MDIIHMIFLGVGYTTLIFILAECIFKRDSSTPNMFRIIYLMPGVISMFAMAQGGGFLVDGWHDDIIIYEYGYNATHSERVTVAGPDPEVWSLWHLGLGLVLMVEVLRTALGLLFMTKRGNT